MKKNYVPSSLLALLLLVVAWKSAKVAAVTAFSAANVAAPNSLGIPVYPYMNNGGNVLTWYASTGRRHVSHQRDVQSTAS